MYRPVSSSDDTTYNRVFVIKKATCHGCPIKEKYKGPYSEVLNKRGALWHK